jgi:hypothetical protein
MHPDGPPDQEHEPARFGLWLENACLAFAINQGQRVTYWREEPLEVDAVFEGSWGDWAIEIKTGGFDLYDLKGLLEFCRRNTKFRPLIITAPGDEPLATDTAYGPSAGSNSWSMAHLNLKNTPTFLFAYSTAYLGNS